MQQNTQFILFFFLIFLQITLITTQSFDPKRVKLLDVGYKADNDSTHFNLLFRSNRPTNSKQTEFKYDELISAMKEAAKAKNIYLNTSAENYLIVYSLLHSDDETNVAEMNFFDKNEEKGEMRSWPIYGTTLNSENFTQEQIFNISSDLSWFMDDSLDDLTFDLYSTLNNFDYSSANLLIVFHCTHGKDRTGEVAGSYNLKYNHQTWEQVSATNFEIGAVNKIMSFINQRALTWFCYHLQYHQNYTQLSCTNENLSDDSRTKPILTGWDEPNDYFLYFILFYVLLGIYAISLLLFLIILTRNFWWNSRIFLFMRTRISKLKSFFVLFYCPSRREKLNINFDDFSNPLSSDDPSDTLNDDDNDSL